MEQLHTDLLSVGYNGPAIDINIFKEAFNEGPPNIVYADIIRWLSLQLGSLCDLENCISSINDESDLGIGFLVEISSLLKELNCPWKNITTGPIEDRLFKREDKVLAIVYLSSELEAAKMVALKKPKKKETSIKVELSESRTAKELRGMLVSLGFGKPPDDISPQKLFGGVEKKLYTLSNNQAPKNLVGKLLFFGSLTEKHWFQLEKLYKEVYQEYKTRRNLLLTRLDVTIKSFLWAERLKNKSEEVIHLYNKKKLGISDEPNVTIADVLAADEDLALVEKTSNATVRKNTKSAIYGVRIGAVPDRGGRPSEQQPPPPEVPSWQKNETSSRGGRQQFSSYKNTGDRGPPKRDNANRSFQENVQKGGNMVDNKDSYRGRSDYNNAQQPMYQPAYQPVYQPVMISGYGFGGYMPAGDNFQQYGLSDGINNQYQARQNSGSGMRGSGGYDRGSRPYRGRRGRQ